MTYASARGVHAHKVNENLNALHTTEATTAQRLFAAAEQQTGPTEVAAARSSGAGAAAGAASYERASHISSA